MRLVDRTHGVGVSVVPGGEILDRCVLWIALRDRFDQGSLEGGDTVLEPIRPRDGLSCLSQGIGLLVVLERFPGFV